MSYVPPTGSAVTLDFDVSGNVPPDGDTVVLNFGGGTPTPTPTPTATVRPVLLTMT